MVQLRRAGFEPARPKALAPKASASANSATLAMIVLKISANSRRRQQSQKIWLHRAGGYRTGTVPKAKNNSRLPLASRSG